jgi:prepilin-type N-terminal cleavage/methylation domain-containing protein
LRIWRKGRGETGVTLIELVVVMAIIAIMGLLIAPALGRWVDNFRIRQVAREISSDLQFAKMKSISSGVRYTIVFIAGDCILAQPGSPCVMDRYVIFPDYNSDMVLQTAPYTNNGVTVKETDDSKSVSLEHNTYFDTAKGSNGGTDFSLAGGYPAVAFNRSGLPLELSGGQPSPVTTDLSIYLQNTKNGKHLKVTVSASGRIAINEY